MDKYELLCFAQIGDNAKWTEFKQSYPQSVWTKNSYVTPSAGWYANSVPAILNWIRKVSRLTGYNMVPYFEKWGFIRPIAMRVGDYGNKWYLMSEDMLSEFKEDMDALVDSGELKVMPEGMLEDITNYGDKYFTRPTFPRPSDMPSAPSILTSQQTPNGIFRLTPIGLRLRAAPMVCLSMCPQTFSAPPVRPR